MGDYDDGLLVLYGALARLFLAMSTSIHDATPLQLAARQQHKARLARIAARAIQPKPQAVVKVDAIAAPIPAPPEPVRPRHYKTWFSVEAENNLAVTVEHIKFVVAQAFGVTKLSLESARRTDNLVRPRQIAMYLANELTLHSMAFIGHRFGDRDHSTVHHAIEKIERLVQIDAELAEQIAAIRESITP
jgi:chromosomal replication initiation ATPase DnaA